MDLIKLFHYFKFIHQDRRLPYDEYLLLQYYTPTGLNEKDSSGYREWNGQFGHGGTNQEAGLQVFHIDSRLYSEFSSFDPNTGRILSDYYSYVDTIISESKTDMETSTHVSVSKIAASNSRDMSVDVKTMEFYSPNNLISIIPATGINTYLLSSKGDYLGLTNNLFGVGDQYGSDTFTQADYTRCFQNRGKWDDESTLGHSFKVTRNDESSCDISIYQD